jgi:hypothetical protein
MIRRKLVVPRKSGRLGGVAGSVVEYVIPQTFNEKLITLLKRKLYEFKLSAL